jgi:undecaprenyl-diphosphatase
MEQYWIAVVLGVMEGLTEFLPVSSTGHLILLGSLLDFTGEKAKTFEIFIQLGAILAITVLYRQRFLSLLRFRSKQAVGSRLTLLHILLGILPAMAGGFLLHGVIKSYLFSPHTVVIGLVLGGIFMIFAERFNKRKQGLTCTLDQLSYKQALGIGIFQCLALYPGFSRSGSTISGGLLVGADYKTAAEFSFLIAVPMMVAASGYDLLQSYTYLSRGDIGFFAVGFITAFLVAMTAVVSFLKLLQKVKLTPFAMYRFMVAALFWIFIL